MQLNLPTCSYDHMALYKLDYYYYYYFYFLSPQAQNHRQ